MKIVNICVNQSVESRHYNLACHIVCHQDASLAGLNACDQRNECMDTRILRSIHTYVLLPLYLSKYQGSFCISYSRLVVKLHLRVYQSSVLAINIVLPTYLFLLQICTYLLHKPTYLLHICSYFTQIPTYFTYVPTYIYQPTYFTCLISYFNVWNSKYFLFGLHRVR